MRDCPEKNYRQFVYATSPQYKKEPTGVAGGSSYAGPALGY